MIYNIAAVFIFRLLGSTLGFISSVFIVRLLGVDESGYYFLALAFVSLASTFSSLGSSDKIIQTTGANFFNDREIFHQDFFSLIVTVVCSSFLLAIIIFFSSDYVASLLGKSEISELLKKVVSVLPFLALSSLLAGFLLGSKRSKLTTFFMSISIPLLMVLFVAYLTYNGFNIDALNLFDYYNLSVTLSFIALFIVVLILFKKNDVNFSELVKFKFNYPPECVDFWLISVVNVGISSGLMLVASPFLSVSEVSMLSVTTRLCIIVNILIISCNLYAAPYFSQYYKAGDHSSLMFFAKKITRYLLLLTIPFLFILFSFSENILLIFGKEFIAASFILKIVILGQFSSVLVGPCVYLLMMTGNQKKIRNNNALVLLLFLPLTYFLSKEFGLTGAALSISLSLVAQYIPPFFMVKSSLGFYTHSLNKKLL